ncbi:hypothetical protein GCM10022248_00770 [Nonomuraea soli]
MAFRAAWAGTPSTSPAAKLMTTTAARRFKARALNMAGTNRRGIADLRNKAETNSERA